jgi:hypothetical protein
LFAGDGQDRIGTACSQRPQQPCHDQHEVVFTSKIQKRRQRLNGSAPQRERKWLHAGAAAEPDRRVLGDPPSVGADFDATPELIRQIEVDQAVLLGEADRDFVLRTIELGLRLKRIEGCVQRGRARRIPGPLVVLLAQPGPKALAAQRPGFPVAVDDEIGKAGAVACVKEPGGRCGIEEDIRAAHGVRPSSAWPMAT